MTEERIGEKVFKIVEFGEDDSFYGDEELIGERVNLVIGKRNYEGFGTVCEGYYSGYVNMLNEELNERCGMNPDGWCFHQVVLEEV